MDDVVSQLKDKSYYCNLYGIERIINDIKKLRILYYPRRYPDTKMNESIFPCADITLKFPDLPRSIKYLFDQFYFQTFDICDMLEYLTRTLIKRYFKRVSYESPLEYLLHKPESMRLIFHENFLDNIKLLYLDLILNSDEPTFISKRLWIDSLIKQDITNDQVNKIEYDNIVLFSCYRFGFTREYMIIDGENPDIIVDPEEFIRYYYKKIKQILDYKPKSARSVL